MTSARLAPVALLGATVAVSVSAVLIQEARTDAGTVVWVRMAIAVVVLTPWAVPRLARGTVGASRRDALLTATAGVFLAAHFLAWTASLAYTSVAASVLLVSLHPLLVAPLSARLNGDRVSAGVLAGIGLALGGTVVTCIGGLDGGSSPLLGDLLALLGALALAGYLLIGRSRRALGGVMAYSAVVYTVVAVAGVAVTAGHVSGASSGLHAPSVRTLLACAGLAVVCTIGGHTVFNWVLHHMAAGAVSLSFLGEAPLAALLAFVVLGQRPSPSTIAGGVLILAGLAVTLRSTSTEMATSGSDLGALTPVPRSPGR